MNDKEEGNEIVEEDLMDWWDLLLLYGGALALGVVLLRLNEMSGFPPEQHIGAIIAVWFVAVFAGLIVKAVRKFLARKP